MLPSMHRRRFLASSIATLACAALGPVDFAQAKNPALRSKAEAAVEKGLAFLEKAQKPEGYWSSQDYPGLTGLVVQAFATAPGGKHRNSKSVRDALKFIRGQAKPNGGIYNRGMANYNTSIALSTLIVAGHEDDQPLIESARKFLIGAQTKNRANSAEDGGFGYDPGDSGRASRPDMDNTVFALEALALYRDTGKAKERPGEQDLNWKAAIDFLTRCQNLPATNKEKWASDAPAEKGGFTYTPSGDDEGTHSYGTMSYAGLLSLIHAQVKKDDERVKAVVDWLSRHYTLEENPGHGEAGLYYYYFVMAKGLTAAGLDMLPTTAGKSVNWRDELAGKLLSLQKPDGSWANENGRWMEKEPVLVTSYVVLALNILLQRL
jgi:squalene-hopene/tetraprenyl-beta-curcumene cyclase